MREGEDDGLGIDVPGLHPISVRRDNRGCGLFPNPNIDFSKLVDTPTISLGGLDPAHDLGKIDIVVGENLLPKRPREVR